MGQNILRLDVQALLPGMKRRYVMRDLQDITPFDLEDLWKLEIETDEKIINIIMDTNNMLTARSDNAKELFDFFEKKKNDPFEATSWSKIKL